MSPLLLAPLLEAVPLLELALGLAGSVPVATAVPEVSVEHAAIPANPATRTMLQRTGMLRDLMIMADEVAKP